MICSVWFITNIHDNKMIPILPYAPGEYHYVWNSRVKIFAEDNDCFDVSPNVALANEVEWGFIQISYGIWPSEMVETFKQLISHFGKTFVKLDWGIALNGYPVQELLSELKDKITCVISYTPQEAKWVNLITGCNTEFIPEPIFSDFSSKNFIKKKKLLLYGSPFKQDRDGYWGHVLARKLGLEYDFLMRSASKCEDINCSLFPNSHCINALVLPDFLDLLKDYAFITDFSTQFTIGKVGLDALTLGSLFIGFKGMTYASYLCDDLAIENIHGLLDYELPEDIEKHWEIAMKRVATPAEIRMRMEKYL